MKLFGRRCSCGAVKLRRTQAMTQVGNVLHTRTWCKNLNRETIRKGMI